MKTFLSILLTAIVVAIISIAGTYYWFNKRCAAQISALQIQNNTAKTPAADTTATDAETIRKAGIESSKTVVRGYLDAQIKRRYDYALPYMTSSLAQQVTKEEFEGQSDPRVSRYEILSGQYLVYADLYEVKVRVYSSANGKEESYEDNTYLVAKDGVNFQVNEINHGTDFSIN